MPEIRAKQHGRNSTNGGSRDICSNHRLLDHRSKMVVEEVSTKALLSKLGIYKLQVVCETEVKKPCQAAKIDTFPGLSA